MKTALVFLGLAISSQALASGYPAGYCDQIARVSHNGPVVFAHVGSGCESLEVLGYKASGMLANGNPDFIDAVVSTICDNQRKTTVVRLGREWNGKGYLSSAFSVYEYLPAGCYPSSDTSIGFAFTANGQWDSRFGQNYPHPRLGSNRGGNDTVFNTRQAGHGTIVLDAWHFIVNEMDR